MPEKRLGLIAGGGDFTLLFAENAKQKGIRLVCVALKDEALPALEGFVEKIYWVSLGEVRKVIEIFKKEGIREAVMLGSVKKTRFFSGRPDTDASANLVMKLAKDKRDLTLFKAAAMVLRISGIRLVSGLALLKDSVAKKGFLTRKKPTEIQWQDIRFGFRIAKKISGLDIGQTVVVKDKAILAIEAIEGTDEAIKRGGVLGNGDVVVVKAARPNQDMRFDIPVIGLNTLNSLKQARASVLAIERNKTLIIRREELTRLADEAGICIVVI